MDERFWQEFRKRTAQFESSPSFQKWCWEVYNKNKVAIELLVKYRTLLNFKPGGVQDAGLSYLIMKTKEYHPMRWRGLLKQIMEHASHLPHEIVETYLLLIAKKHQLKSLGLQLKGQEVAYYPDNVLSGTANQIKLYVGDLEKDIKNYPNIFMKRKMHAPPSEYLPDWYFIARPEHDFYKKENLAIVNQDLLEKEFVATNKRAVLVNELNDLLLKHAWPNPKIVLAIKNVKYLAKRIKIEKVQEIELKTKTSAEWVARRRVEMVLNLKEQKDTVRKIRDLKGVPSREVYERINKILDTFAKQLDKAIATYS
jgi:hypothetical protein